eukprot:364207-Chlamydomonas_euryale.AAC.1
MRCAARSCAACCVLCGVGGSECLGRTTALERVGCSTTGSQCVDRATGSECVGRKKGLMCVGYSISFEALCRQTGKWMAGRAGMGGCDVRLYTRRGALHLHVGMSSRQSFCQPEHTLPAQIDVCLGEGRGAAG